LVAAKSLQLVIFLLNLLNVKYLVFCKAAVYNSTVANAMTYNAVTTLVLLFLTSITYQQQLSSSILDQHPWRNIEADSDQMSPVYLGATPRDMELSGKKYKIPQLPRPMKDQGLKYAQLIRKQLNVPQVVFEAWPTRDWRGQYFWTYSRWRLPNSKTWNWLDSNKIQFDEEAPVAVAETLDMRDKEHYLHVFQDFLEMDDLYEKPLFSFCVWTNDEGKVIAKWLPPSLRETMAQVFNNSYCHLISQPSRMNGRAQTFLIYSTESGSLYDTAIKWYNVKTKIKNARKTKPIIRKWDSDFNELYKRDIMILDGEMQAVFPISGKKTVFDKKNSAEVDNRIFDVITYLEERYQELGIETYRQTFSWRNITQGNLIARIKGRTSDKPVLMGDHIDTAFAGDYFEKTGK
jgi:hypothetical protein